MLVSERYNSDLPEFWGNVDDMKSRAIVVEIKKVFIFTRQEASMKVWEVKDGAKLSNL